MIFLSMSYYIVIFFFCQCQYSHFCKYDKINDKILNAVRRQKEVKNKRDMHKYFTSRKNAIEKPLRNER